MLLKNLRRFFSTVWRSLDLDSPEEPRVRTSLDRQISRDFNLRSNDQWRQRMPSCWSRPCSLESPRCSVVIPNAASSWPRPSWSPSGRRSPAHLRRHAPETAKASVAVAASYVLRRHVWVLLQPQLKHVVQYRRVRPHDTNPVRLQMPTYSSTATTSGYIAL